MKKVRANFCPPVVAVTEAAVAGVAVTVAAVTVEAVTMAAVAVTVVMALVVDNLHRHTAHQQPFAFFLQAARGQGWVQARTKMTRSRKQDQLLGIIVHGRK